MNDFLIYVNLVLDKFMNYSSQIKDLERVSDTSYVVRQAGETPASPTRFNAPSCLMLPQLVDGQLFTAGFPPEYCPSLATPYLEGG